ncbi:hypothetical protein [Spiroplasma sp. AdecLV25b]|uniref:hypothetical protein n=1 Tax=Spiroplasma sp. AdecLV25b TaxID=3027162 RepID=UPI0027DF6C60|nr:hypothetical protein [Spiroplasma sp. AdecLV25b]
MLQYDETVMIFVTISLFLVTVILICQLIQLCFWLIIKLKTKNKNNLKPYYQELLASKDLSCQVVKKKFIIKYFNYNVKTNVLKLKTNDFNETTTWNKYQTLCSVLCIKWKNKYQPRKNLSLPIINLCLLIGIINTIICTLLFYIPIWTNTSSDINQEVLAIFSFAGLIIITLSWLFWTMFYEKMRKEIMNLTSGLEDHEVKIIKYITLFKSCFPFADLMF